MSVAIVFLISQSPWIMMYAIGTIQSMNNPFVMLGFGLVFLPSLCALILKLIPMKSKDVRGGGTHKRNLFYYMCCMCSWSCTIDLIIFLESIDVIQGFMGFYLENGEPYLGSPFGIFANLWDATVHYLLYLVIIYKYDKKQHYRDYGLYWCGSMSSSMFCLIIGAAVGNYGNDLHPAILLNIPYIILPIYAFFHISQSVKRGREETKLDSKGAKSHFLSRCVLICGLMFTILYCLLRGLAALDSPNEYVQYYVDEYEPYIAEPAKFGKMHCLFLMVLGIPLQAVALYGLFGGEGKWVNDYSLIYAGATAQGTFFHLGAQLSSRTDPTYRLSYDNHTIIWLNMSVTIIAHLWAYWCHKEKYGAKKKTY